MLQTKLRHTLMLLLNVRRVKRTRRRVICSKRAGSTGPNRSDRRLVRPVNRSGQRSTSGQVSGQVKFGLDPKVGSNYGLDPRVGSGHPVNGSNPESVPKSGQVSWIHPAHGNPSTCNARTRNTCMWPRVCCWGSSTRGDACGHIWQPPEAVNHSKFLF